MAGNDMDRHGNQTIGIILNGATGRICSTQHVANALVPIRDEGGLPAGDDRIVPRLMLVGRNADKLAAVAKSYGARMDHRPRRGAGRSGLHACSSTPPRRSQRAGRAGQGHRRRQAHLFREAGGAVGGQGPGAAARDARRAASSTARSRTSSACPACRSSRGSRRRISSAASPASASSSAGGCSTAPRCRASGRAGTTAGRTAAG